MRKILYFERFKGNVRAGMVNMACVLMIALLTGACAGGYKKQTSSYSNETGQVSEKGETENGETKDDQKIVCRWIVQTGSRMKKKYCTTQAKWTKYDKEKGKKSAEFIRDVSQDTAVGTGSGTDAMGGQTSGVPR